MGLFSVNKLLALILIIGAVWYGFKLFARRSQNLGGRQHSARIGSGQPEKSEKPIQDMESCTVCGTFVPNAAAKACGRDNCPYPD